MIKKIERDLKNMTSNHSKIFIFFKDLVITLLSWFSIIYIGIIWYQKQREENINRKIL